jgi:glutamate-1-semialdehyde 2,1-aminomutase
MAIGFPLSGPVYQAGTLSGNPIAMNAGLASLKKLKSTPNLHTRLEEKAKKLMAAFKDSAQSAGIPLQVDVRGSMFGFFFNDNEVKNFDDALKSDTDKFALFHQKMLQNGVYLACSQYETGFISTVMNDEMIDEVIQIADKVFKELS